MLRNILYGVYSSTQHCSRCTLYLEGIVGVCERVVFGVILFQVALYLARHDVEQLQKGPKKHKEAVATGGAQKGELQAKQPLL